MSDMDFVCDLIESIDERQKMESNLVATHYYIKGSSTGGTGFTIEARNWKDGKVTSWALMRGVQRFDKIKKHFRHEPLNSSKDDRYIKSHSFDTLEGAYDAYVAFREAYPEFFRGPPDVHY